MRKPSSQFLARVRVRAYYAWEYVSRTAPHSVLTAEAYWLMAEQIELRKVATKTASARKSKAKRAPVRDLCAEAGAAMTANAVFRH